LATREEAAVFCSHNAKQKQIMNLKEKAKAKQLFIAGKHEQREIAQIVGVTVQTICRWIKKENWKVLRRVGILDLTQLLDIASKIQDADDREYLLNLYKKLGGL